MRIALILLALPVLFFSCQKEPNEALPNGTGGGSGDSTLLMKYIELDTSLSSGLDTLDKEIFEYDDLKRLTVIRYFYRADTASTTAYSDTEVQRFYYSGNDPYPYKSTLYQWMASGGYTSNDTTYYTYQGNSLVADSAISHSDDPQLVDPAVSARYYSTLPNGVMVRIRYYSIPSSGPPSPCESLYNIVQNKVNGNIVSENGSSTGCETGTYSWQMSYDTHVNPFHSMSLPYPSILFSGFDWNIEPNNLIDALLYDGNYHVTYRYEYRNDGYPVVARVRAENISAGVVYNAKTLYVYSK